jgi:hypothetical protein
MVDYVYSRELVEGRYDIDNKNRVDGEGNQIHLSNEVSIALPGKLFRLVCDAGEAKFIFNTSLSPEEELVLDACVTAHKNNT